VDVLSVGRHDDEHDEDDADGDLPRVGGDEGATGQAEHEHDLVGRVGHRGERVAGEDRQREALGQEGLPQPVAAHGSTDEEALEHPTGIWHAHTVCRAKGLGVHKSPAPV